MLDINTNMEYRLYEKGDEEEIVDLLFQIFKGWPKYDLPVSPLEHWKWKFLDNPYGSIIALSCDNNKIVGCQHILLKNIKVGNNEYQSGIGVDIALHPDYRGRGIANSLTDSIVDWALKESIVRRVREGASVLISSHLLHLVEEICTHILILKSGRKVADGTMADIKERFLQQADRSNLEEVFFRATSDEPENSAP